jgi:hypothetical protein
MIKVKVRMLIKYVHFFLALNTFSNRILFRQRSKFYLGPWVVRRVRKYAQALWDSFITPARNGTNPLSANPKTNPRANTASALKRSIEAGTGFSVVFFLSGGGVQ